MTSLPDAAWRQELDSWQSSPASEVDGDLPHGANGVHMMIEIVCFGLLVALVWQGSGLWAELAAALGRWIDEPAAGRS